MVFIKNSKISIVLVIVCSIVLLIIGKCQTLEMGYEYGFYGISIISVCIGWMLLWAISFIMKQISFFSASLRWLGRKSIYVLLFHFVGFKFVTFMQIKILEKPISNLASFPIYLDGYSFWYTIFGLAFSILVAISVEKIIYRIKITY